MQENDLIASLLKAASLEAKKELYGLSEEERMELSAWLQEQPYHANWEHDAAYRAKLLAEYRAFCGQSTREWKKFHAAYLQENTRLRIISIRRWWAAAAMIILAGVGAYWWAGRSMDKHTVVQTNIQPGREGAILTLADGSQLLLDTVRNGTVALQGGSTAKVVNGALVYEGSSENLIYNTMSTPRGRQFQLTLPDGSKVWLNSASSIRYPVTFKGDTREVKVTGEAYFEIAADAHKPFTVDVDGKANVKVLGTHFNISAYTNEPKLAATLLEGAIMLALPGIRSVLLKPGQQAQVITNDIRVTDKADTSQVIAWKNGLFSFGDLSFEEVMRQLERWYDIRVVYEKDVPNIHLTGKMTRGVSLDGLLKNLKKMGLRYRLENKTLIIEH